MTIYCYFVENIPMKRVLILCSMLALASTAFAQTTVYSYVSKPYVDINEFVSAPEPVLFAPFTETMHLQATITAPKPFPANLNQEPIGEGTSHSFTWSFNTGLTSFNASTGFLPLANVSTDASGNIISIQLQAFSAQPLLDNDQQLEAVFLIYGAGQTELPIEGAVYTNLNLCTNDEEELDDSCSATFLGSGLSAAALPIGGVWSRSSPAATAVPVPGLGGLAVMGLGALMVGMLARRKHPAKNAL